MIAVRLHSHNGEVLLAACDDELLGRTLTDGKVKLTVSESFYNGEMIPDAILVERMKSVVIMNLVGNRTVGIAIREGYVKEDCVMTIDGVKHAQVVMM